jgi:hypothetical protein
MFVHKKCSICGEEKPANTEYFGRVTRNKDGLNSKCIICHKEYMRSYNQKHYTENKEYYNLKSKKWAEENHERTLKLQRDWYKENYPKIKEEENQRSREYFEKHPNYRKERYEATKTHHSELTKKWYEENKEKHKELTKRWRSENRELVNMYCRNYQHKKKGLPFDFSPDDWDACLDYFDNSCAYCGEKSDRLEKEHFIPVSKGGAYTKDNIIPSCKSCNVSKHAHDFLDWYPSRSYYNEEKERNILIYLGIIEEETNSQSPFSYANNQ